MLLLCAQACLDSILMVFISHKFNRKFLWVLLNLQLVIILIDIDDVVGESCRCGLVFYLQQISWVPPCGDAGHSLSSPAPQLGAFNWISAQIAFIIVLFMRCEGANHELDSSCLALSEVFCFDQSVIKFLDTIKVSVWAGDSMWVWVRVCECMWVCVSDWLCAFVWFICAHNARLLKVSFVSLKATPTQGKLSVHQADRRKISCQLQDINQKASKCKCNCKMCSGKSNQACSLHTLQPSQAAGGGRGKRRS